MRFFLECEEIPNLLHFTGRRFNGPMAWPWGCSSPTTCGHDPWKCEEDLQEDQQWFLILVSTQINSISKCRLCQRLWFRTLLRTEKCQKNTPQSTADISNHKLKSFPQILFHVTWSSIRTLSANSSH